MFSPDLHPEYILHTDADVWYQRDINSCDLPIDPKQPYSGLCPRVPQSGSSRQCRWVPLRVFGAWLGGKPKTVVRVLVCVRWCVLWTPKATPTALHQLSGAWPVHHHTLALLARSLARSGPACAGGQPTQLAFYFMLVPQQFEISDRDHNHRLAALLPCSPRSPHPASFSCMPATVSGSICLHPALHPLHWPFYCFPHSCTKTVSSRRRNSSGSDQGPHRQRVYAAKQPPGRQPIAVCLCLYHCLDAHTVASRHGSSHRTRPVRPFPKHRHSAVRGRTGRHWLGSGRCTTPATTNKQAATNTGPAFTYMGML